MFTDPVVWLNETLIQTDSKFIRLLKISAKWDIGFLGGAKCDVHAITTCQMQGPQDKVYLMRI